MRSKTKLLGHAIHPMLVHVPLGMFVIAALFDSVDRIAGQTTDLTVASFWKRYVNQRKAANLSLVRVSPGC